MPATTAEYTCHREDVALIASYAAPGIGWHGRCHICGRDWFVIGASLHDPAEMADIAGPEDVI
jgi:hypothetical protein